MAHTHKIHSSLKKLVIQSEQLWSIINQFDPDYRNSIAPDLLHHIIELAFILEEHIQNTITIERPFKGPDSSQHPDNLDNVIGKMTAFYSLPALHPKQVRHSTNSLTSQLAANRRKIPQNNTKNNFFPFI